MLFQPEENLLEFRGAVKTYIHTSKAPALHTPGYSVSMTQHAANRGCCVIANMCSVSFNNVAEIETI